MGRTHSGGRRGESTAVPPDEWLQGAVFEGWRVGEMVKGIGMRRKGLGLGLKVSWCVGVVLRRD